MTSATELSGASADIELRTCVRPSDADAVEAIVTATGKFYPDEVAIARELVDAHLAKGETSGYSFSLAELAGEVIGYACYGPIPCTQSSYDLYWIAVNPRIQGRGIGRRLVAAAEQHIRALGGTRVFIDTSMRAEYAPTRAFYERCGYAREAVLADFYRPGDGKAIYAKAL